MVSQNGGSAPPSARASMLLGANLNVLLSARKDMPYTPSTKMKQLQWDKLSQQSVGRTLWREAESTETEKAMLEKLAGDGIWREMEEDFKAKQLVINLLARQKRAELKSVLDPQTKKNLEILIQRVKKLAPEEVALKIRDFDPDVCTQTFLSGLKNVVPTPEQIGKLNVYRNAEPEELAGLHPADRLMVKLIQIDRLGPRIENMLYKITFDDQWLLLDESARKLTEAGRALLGATHFKELLNLILLIGNYMNGTGVKGGAFGFRVSSINKLVDTKSVNNTTLLHFLERTVAKHFAHLEEFSDELSKPAEAYRVNLQDVRKNLGELREGLKKIRSEMNEHFTDIEKNDRYSKQMWSFLGKATQRLEDLVDDVNTADTTYTEVITYFGEEDKNMSSSEFYGIFKTFITSYRKCQTDNRTAAEEKMAVEKRKQAVEDAKASRRKALEEATAREAEDTAALDNLLEKLRNGDSVGRRRRDRARPSAASASIRPSLPSLPDGDETADRARGLLEQLKTSGFMSADMLPPPSPMAPSAPRRRRLRSGSMAAELAAELEAAGSPLGSPREEQELPPQEPEPEPEPTPEEPEYVHEADTSIGQSEELQLAALASRVLGGDG
ncbi:hypothetical protein K488DRAFT_85106 [Vararia minispora EC-137]|uniref:Uncharacterized protein n=1 Tax=Vararia minispora EC-137 TaxID=1314806 RepID=A0ACB8QP10_9AGAM|nr:hypothetical protein K488DRAFT_85106 [Vararia minispora EC-137]